MATAAPTSSARAAPRKGPQVRSHAHDLPKKVRALGLQMALSAKAKAGELIVLDKAVAGRAEDEGAGRGGARSSAGRRRWSSTGRSSTATSRARRATWTGFALLPSAGANVYDILNHKTLVLTRAAVEALEARLA